MRKCVCSIWIFMGCTVVASAVQAPRLRPSPYFGSLTGVSFTEISDLGRHDYDNFFGENNSLIYTAKAGYIDLGHLRESADRARYIYEICYDNICRSKTGFSYEVIEPAVYHVRLTYPENWKQLSQDEKSRIAHEVAVDLGQHFAHLSTVWHEIITWYGYASTGLFSEKASSFSWEDSYSDLFGTKLGAMALRENTQSYNDAMTGIILHELEKLDPMSAETAKSATKKIRGNWYSGRYPFLSMKRRNFDVGFDDGYISPFRVPGIRTDTPAVKCKVPELESLTDYGFTMRLTMTPRASERKDVLPIIYPAGNATKLEPERDFPVIIEHIRSEAISDEGSNVDKPVL